MYVALVGGREYIVRTTNRNQIQIMSIRMAKTQFSKCVYGGGTASEQSKQQYNAGENV